MKVNVYAVSGISSANAQSMLNTSISAIDAHAGRFGAYPYGEVDAVLDNNFWFGGMEYPGFVLDLVSTTALTHELAHQWWYGIVGDDEYNSPWLDEAFADYSTDLALGSTGDELLEQRVVGVVEREDHQLDGVLGRPLVALLHRRLRLRQVRAARPAAAHR